MKNSMSASIVVIKIYAGKNLVMKLNDKQLDIIESCFDKNILVAAAAGSGKTRVLVEKIINLISDKETDTSLTNIVVMTFTNKATSEMKYRIKQRLEEKIIEDKKNIKLIRENSLIQNARISTIDSFCKRILDENYSILDDFDPSYRMAENKELSILYDDILESLLEEKYADEYFKSLFDMYYIKNDRKIKELLLNGLKFLSSIPFECDFLKDRIVNFEKESREVFCEYKCKCKEKLLSCLKPLEKIDEAISILDSIESDAINSKKVNATSSKLIALRDYFRDTLRTSLSDVDLNNVNLDLIKILVDIFNEKRLPDIKRLIGDFFGHRDEYDAIIVPILNIYFNENQNNIFFTYRLICEAKDEYIVDQNEKKILELLLIFIERVNIEKKKKNVISINDPQKYALNILYEKVDGKYVISERAKEISKNFKYIFVDEYQDTSLIQELILRAISIDFSNNNVFMVGDIKQSIYRFRNAEPSIFVKKFDLYSKGDAGVVKILDTNYRSRDNIIKFVNSIFSRLMLKNYGDIDYVKNDMLSVPSDEEKIEMSKHRSEEYNIDKKVEVKLLTSEDKGTGVKKVEKEAMYVARKIKELVSAGVKYKDIVILLSSVEGKASYFIDELSKASIPSYADLKKGFYDRFEIKLMIDILSIVDNPYQDIPLASVIMSSIYSVNNKELAYIKLAYDKYIEFGKNEEFRLYDAVKYVATIANDELKNKLTRFLNDFEMLSYKARYLSISDLITFIYDDMNVYNIILSMNDGRVRAANLDILYNNAKGFEKSSYVGLFNFLRYVEKIVERKDDEGIAKVYDENENIVRIMTIHSSKGLEFPIVFLSDANKEFNTDELKSEFVFDKEIGIGIDYVNEKERYSFDGIKKSVILDRLKDKIIEEQIRVLYVALTRAKEKLIITGFANKKTLDYVNNSLKFINEDEIDIIEKTKEISKEKEIEYIEYIRENGSFMKLIARFFPYSKDFCNISVENVDLVDAEDVKQYDENLIEVSEDNCIISYDALKKDLCDSYGYHYLRDLEPKFSVSKIKRDSKKKKIEMLANVQEDNIAINNYYEDDGLNIDINSENERVDGTMIGNAYHRYMQYYDYEKNTYNCKNEAQNDKICTKLIDTERINKYVNSNIGKRMALSYKNRMLYREQKFMKLFSKNDIDLYMGNKEKLNISIDELNKKQIIIQGIIDAFFIEKDSEGNDYIVLVDYKTDKINSENIDNADKFKNSLISNYKVQLDIYAKVLSDLTGIPVNEKYIYSFAINEEIKV